MVESLGKLGKLEVKIRSSDLTKETKMQYRQVDSFTLSLTHSPLVTHHSSLVTHSPLTHHSLTHSLTSDNITEVL